MTIISEIKQPVNTAIELFEKRNLSFEIRYKIPPESNFFVS